MENRPASKSGTGNFDVESRQIMPQLAPDVWDLLWDGTVIPAHPLALNQERRLDERRQRALSRYYLDAGAGGIAVGVHTTQFEIRDPRHGLYEPVLSLAAEEMLRYEDRTGQRRVRVAGIAGPTNQAVREAAVAKVLGYDLGLVSLGALGETDNDGLIDHLKAVGDVIPIFGFYLQPSVGGRPLEYSFWRRAVELEAMRAIKVAPFNRYLTHDVVRAVADGGRAHDLALYTGNDDNIIFDLLAHYRFEEPDGPVLGFRGGLLGQWAVWTQKAVEMMDEIKAMRRAGESPGPTWYVKAQQLTDANAVLFDFANAFHGCIPGIHEVLRRQGLLEGLWTLNPAETLSPGQVEELDRIYRIYPWLHDDAFVEANRDRWLSG